ncbi:phosphotransferase family protein [Haloferax namakaokahaiae]|uniref:Phosphotransferase family protein n=1 Tax=Haloferax namakaokahaiae TaxID=1748331 RepID=A0ABD5ZII9_9EURY
MDSRVASALAHAFPSRDVAEVHATGPSWNDSNHTVGVAFEDGQRAFVKVAADGDGERIVRESAVIERVAGAGLVPVPEIVARDPDHEIPYLVTEPVDGSVVLDLWDDGDRAELTRRVGAALARVHSLGFDAHGDIFGGGPTELEAERGRWADVLADRIEMMRGLASDTRFDHHYDAVKAAVFRNRDVLDAAPATLVHGDPAQPNAFQQDGEIGFLDWEIAHVGDPARDLHRAQSQQFGSFRSPDPEHLVTALHEGYRSVAGGLPLGYAEREPIYEAVRFLGVSGYTDKWIELIIDEPASEFVSWVEAEMKRRLAEL